MVESKDSAFVVTNASPAIRTLSCSLNKLTCPGECPGVCINFQPGSSEIFSLNGMGLTFSPISMASDGNKNEKLAINPPPTDGSGGG